MSIYASEWPSSNPRPTGGRWPVIDREKLPVREVGSIVPEIEADDLRGRKMTLSEHRGKIVMLVFWTSGAVRASQTFCTRSRSSSDSPADLSKSSVNADDSVDDALAAVEKHSIPWRSFWNGGAGGPTVAGLFPPIASSDYYVKCCETIEPAPEFSDFISEAGIT